MKIMRPWSCVGGALKKLRDDRSGISLIYVTVALPVIIGFALLAIDVSRLWSLQSSLQHAADSIALAAAGELDGRPDAIARSQLAINNMVSNPALFADSVTTIDASNVTPRWLKSLPANDADPITASNDVPSDPTEASLQAQYVQITVNPVNFTSFFPATFLGALNAKLVSATAVAGFKAAVCKFTPMWICNPYEDITNPNESITESPELFAAIADPAQRKRQIKMRNVSGGSATPFPGNFGFLEPPDNPGAAAVRDMIGQANPPACFTANGVNFQTGAIVSARFGFNVRFDMYDGPMNSHKNDTEFRPSLDVRKAYTGPKCNPSPAIPPDSQITPGDGIAHLPRDNCFYTSSCTLSGGNMGNGNWDKNGYWQENYGTSLPAALSGSDISRYDVYRYEIDNGMVPHVSAGGETGSPQCYNGPVGSLSDDPDRRIFYAAAINCQLLNADPVYGPITGSSSPVPLPVVAFLKMFITEPVGCNGTNCRGQDTSGATDKSVWAEMVDVVKPGAGGNEVTRDQVQLYR